MKIGIMLRHFEQHEGGVKVYTRNLLSRLLEIDQENKYVFMYPRPGLIGTYGAYPNVEEIAIRVPGTVPWDQIAVPWLARRKKLDLIFNPKFTVPLLGRARKIFVLHGSEWFVIPEHFRWYDRLYIKASFRQYCHAAEAVVTVAHAVKRDVVAATGIDPEKFVPIHNGFDPGVFRRIDDVELLERVRRRYSLPEQFMLWVGQIEGRKNLPNVLHAFARIRNNIPHKLVIAGADTGNERGELNLIRELGLTDRVLLPGWVEHDALPAFYNLASLFIFPSLQEGFGIPLLEAMACGCPIITAKTCAPPEVVGDAGVLVDPLNIDEIAAAMDTVLHDTQKRQEMIQRGLVRVREFGWDKCARELLRLFHAVARRSEPAGPRATKHPPLWPA